MSRAYPSMTALLGLLAIAGYQNRDKIGEWLGGLTGNDKPGAPGEPKSSGLDGILAPWRDNAAAGGPADASARDAGGFLGGGLKDLVDQFRNAGHGETVDSWVGSGPNHPTYRF